MAQEGGQVIICSRNEKNVADAVAVIQKAGGKVDGIVCDVSSAKERAKLVEHIKTKHGGKLDVLVPNVAVSTHMG